MNAPISRNHHYVPEGYLKRWNGPDHKIAVFYMTADGVVRARRKSPGAVGYRRDLYTAPVFKRPDELERSFMGPLDDLASKVLDMFNDCRPGDTLPPMGKHLRDGWSRFIMSLWHRSPARVAERRAQFAQAFEATKRPITDGERAEYAEHRQPDWPETFEGYLATTILEYGSARIIAKLSDSEMLGTHLNGMNQRIMMLFGRHNLLTSDQPLVMSAGLGDPNCVLLLAVGPRHLFVATNNEFRMNQAHQHFDTGGLVADYNASVCVNAEKQVFGSYEREIGFVYKWFRKGKI